MCDKGDKDEIKENPTGFVLDKGDEKPAGLFLSFLFYVRILQRTLPVTRAAG